MSDRDHVYGFIDQLDELEDLKDQVSDLHAKYLTLLRNHVKLLTFVSETTDDGAYLRWCAERKALASRANHTGE
jgi:hypothetical protein